MSHVMRLALLATAIVAMAPAAALARDDIRVERVQFAHGASSAVVEGSITGDETVDYVLGARKGQTANISMATDNGANYFNILAPGENEVALFNGSTGENQFEGVLPESGDYKIRVYLMRSAARRNEKAKYRLEMIVQGAGAPAGQAHGGATPDDALVPGTSYHATGDVPCSMGKGQPTSRRSRSGRGSRPPRRCSTSCCSPGSVASPSAVRPDTAPRLPAQKVPHARCARGLVRCGARARGCRVGAGGRHQSSRSSRFGSRPSTKPMNGNCML